MQYNSIKELNPKKFIIYKKDGYFVLSHKASSPYVCRRGNIRHFTSIDTILTTIDRATHGKIKNVTFEYYAVGGDFKEND